MKECLVEGIQVEFYVEVKSCLFMRSVSSPSVLYGKVTVSYWDNPFLFAVKLWLCI